MWVLTFLFMETLDCYLKLRLPSIAFFVVLVLIKKLVNMVWYRVTVSEFQRHTFTREYTEFSPPPGLNYLSIKAGFQ